MKTIYTKYTDYRKACFRIMTSIREDRDIRVVVKETAPGGHADAHLRSIAANYPLLESFYAGRLSVCPCLYENGRLIFSYVEGTSLLETMRHALQHDGLDSFLALLREYMFVLTGSEANVMPFSYTKKFEEVFGEISDLEGVPALQISNLDASPANIIETREECPTLIDYEWVFPFPIPRDFVVFRHLRFLYSEPAMDWNNCVTLGELMQECGVEMDLPKLSELYEAFQRYVCVEDNASISCAQVFERHRKPSYDGGEGLFRKPKNFVFLDTGSGFNEQEKLIFPSMDGNVDLTIDVENVYNVRFDPFEGQRTLTSGISFRTDTGQELPYSAPETISMGERTVWCVPANAQVQIPSDAKKLYIRGFLLFLGERDEYWLKETSDAERQRDEAQLTLEQANERHAEEMRARVAALEENSRRMEQGYLDALAQKEQELEQLRTAHVQEMQMRQSYEQKLQKLHEEAASLSAAVQAMRNSTSWRMTGWLRKLGSLRRRSQSSS